MRYVGLTKLSFCVDVSSKLATYIAGLDLRSTFHGSSTSGFSLVVGEIKMFGEG